LNISIFFIFVAAETMARTSRALIAAGTGLGQSILVWDGARYRIVPSEGGHSDFAPHTEQQIELLRFMRRRYPQDAVRTLSTCHDSLNS
jgi:glucokinase